MGDYRIEVFLKTRECRSIDVAEIVKKRYRIPQSIDCPRCGKSLQLHESEDHYFHLNEPTCVQEVPVIDYVSEEFAKAEVYQTGDEPAPGQFEEIKIKHYVELTPAILKVVEEPYMIAKQIYCYKCRGVLGFDKDQLVWRHKEGSSCHSVISIKECIASQLQRLIREDFEVGEDEDDELYNKHLLYESYAEDDLDEDDEEGDDDDEDEEE